MIERPGLNFFNASTTVVVQIVVGVILIPRIGVTGAALSMCAGFAVQAILRFTEVRHVFGWSWPWPTLKRPVAAFTLAMVPAAILRMVVGAQWELIPGVLFFLLYAGAWRLLGAEPADREVWRRLMSRKPVISHISAEPPDSPR